MLKFIFNILFLFITLGSIAQQEGEQPPNNPEQPKETNKKQIVTRYKQPPLPERQTFIRIGTDLTRFLSGYVHDINMTGYEFSVDGEIKYSYFPTLEIGHNIIDDESDIHHYKAQGNYYRIGLDYNLLKYQHRLDRNMFYVGFRYAFTSFSQEVPLLTFENDYGVLNTSIPKTDLNAHWAEFILGLKGEIAHNFFMGFSVRLKTLISQTDDNGITPFFIPGYGKGQNSIHAGVNYSVYYAIPIKKIALKNEGNSKK